MKSVLEAIRRWEAKELLAPQLADRLRAEVDEESAAGTQRLFQYVLATTGAVILLVAGGVFLDWAWPLMTEALRTGVLCAVGLAVHFGGVRLEGGRRWLPASYLMQTAGLGLLVIGLMYSDNAWPDLSAGGIATGVVALALPFALGLRTLRMNTVMPAVHLSFGLLFLTIFLDRATPLQAEDILWVLDGVLLLAILRMMRLLAGDPKGERFPWVLNAFAMSLYVGFILMFVTGDISLGLGEDAVYPADAWLFLIVAVTVYGIHWAPEGIRRGWFGVQLALCQLVWIPLGFVSTVEVAAAPPEAALVAVAGSGVAGFLYARRSGVREVLAVSALSFVIGAWYWGTERAGALGAVAALAVTAGLLFWASGKGADPGAVAED